MIRLITESRDHTINRVIDNLILLNLPFERINTDQLTLLTINNFKIDESVKIIYNRRGSYNVLPPFSYPPYLWRYLKKETNDVIFLLEQLECESIYRIGSLQAELTNNKLLNLKTAEDVGFKIPKTIITNSKKDLLKFYKKHKKIITKDLKYPVSWIKRKKKQYLGKGTFLVNKNHIDSLNDFFVPMIFQNFISRKFEIRTFFFIDMCFSVAIIPPNNNIIDVRNSNKENRIIPYQLPKDIINQLIDLSKKLGINTFSSDIIFTKDDNYVFLELNPMGQYDFVDQFGYFDIPKKIAIKFKQIIERV